MPLALLVEGVFHWGFSVRVVSESAAANPYPAPPPSTLIGALAYGCAVTKGMAECYEAEGRYSTAAKLLEQVLWASFSFKKIDFQCFTPCTDMMRMFSLIYQRGERHKLEYKGMWFGVRGHGKVYYPNGGFAVIYLLDDGILDLVGSDQDLVKAAFSITRIGSKESLVSVLSAEITRSIEAASLPVSTGFYFPAKLVESFEEERTISVTLPRLARDSFSLDRQPLLLGAHEDFFIPVSSKELWSPGEVSVYKISGEGSILKASFPEHGEVFLIVPRDVASRMLG